jgi:F420H(2)-dependent biliverdin reductase
MGAVDGDVTRRYVWHMVDGRLNEARNVWLATARPDGRPHLAPVWFVVVDDRLWMCTGLDSVRVRNLRANPSASACLEPGDEPVVAEGTVAIHVAIHETGQPAAVIEAFRTKYDWDITVEVDNDLGRLALLEFRPHRWLFGLELPTVPAP